MMIDKIIYSFYPKNIDSISMKNEYLKSDEYIRLSNRIQFYKNYPENIIKLIDLLKKIDSKKRFDDFTVFDWENRSFNFQLSEIINNKLIKININISILSNFYHIYLTDTIIDSKGNFIGISKENTDLETGKYFNLINIISENIEKVISYEKFPKDLINKIIPNINFHDIEMGKFTYYNALFQNEI